MSEKSPFFSVILPTYNRLYSLVQFILPSLEKQKDASFELIVIDDSSSDGTEAYFSSSDFTASFPNLAQNYTYYQNPQNSGAPASRNRGAEKAVGEWLYIVEDDVEISDAYLLSKAQKIIKQLPDSVAVVCPKREEGRSSGYYTNPPRSFIRIGHLSGELYMDPFQEYSGYVISAHASSFIKREVYLRFKEDEKLFVGNTLRDEADLYFRIDQVGLRIWYCADILKTKHRNDIAATGGQKKINELSLFTQERMVWKNHYKYLAKHYNHPRFKIVWFVMQRCIKVSTSMLGFKVPKNTLAYLKF